MDFDRRALVAKRARQHAARLVFAGHADEDAARAERGYPTRNVSRPADNAVFAPHCNDWDRRLRRYARHLAVDKIIKHHVADAEHRRACEFRELLIYRAHEGCDWPARPPATTIPLAPAPSSPFLASGRPTMQR